MQPYIHYTTDHPPSFEPMLALYEALGWNSLQLTVDELERICKQSWHTVYAYDGTQLVGTGRVISDGVLSGVICGVGVLPSYQSQGIGKQMVQQLVAHCEQHRVIPQLMCVEQLTGYYAAMGFEPFATGMTKRIRR